VLLKQGADSINPSCAAAKIDGAYLVRLPMEMRLTPVAMPYPLQFGTAGETDGGASGRDPCCPVDHGGAGIKRWQTRAIRLHLDEDVAIGERAGVCEGSSDAACGDDVFPDQMPS
jgi:hypothetical protein